MKSDFQTMSGVRAIARRCGFREPVNLESTEEYRLYLAEHVAGENEVLAHELRLGKNFSDWTEAEHMAYILKTMETEMM